MGMRRSREERGAVMVMSVVFLSIVMLLAAFVIDVGINRIVRTDMQSVADTMALDIARTMDGTKTTAELRPSSAFLSAKADSLARNAPSAAADIADADVDVEFGIANDVGVWRRPAGDTEVPNAVRVTVSGATSARLLSGARPAHPSRPATAVNPALACFAVGSSLAKVRSGDSVVLRGILNDSLGANVISGAGLAALDLTVPIAGIQTRLGLATPAELLDLGIASFLNAAATVLGSGTTAGLQLATIATRLGSSALKVRDVLDIETGGASGLGTDLNLVDLVTAAVIAADSDHALNVPNAGLNLGTLTAVNVTAKVIEPKQSVACGPRGTTATQSQIQLTLSAKVASGLNLVDLSLVVNAANATGTLSSARCGPDQIGIDVETSTAGGKLSLALVGGLAGVELPLSLVEGPDRNVLLSYPPETAEVSGVGSLGLSGTVNLRIALITVPINLGLLVPGGLDSLLSGIVTSVLGSLGVSVNGGHVAAVSHPVCDQPALRK